MILKTMVAQQHLGNWSQKLKGMVVLCQFVSFIKKWQLFKINLGMVLNLM
jgi:hypothetical protein